VRGLFEHYFILPEKIHFSARTIQRTVKSVANAATISRPVSPHVLRHSFAMLWIHKGGSTRALQMMLGHDHLSTTEIYLNMSPEFMLHEFRSKW